MPQMYNMSVFTHGNYGLGGVWHSTYGHVSPYVVDTVFQSGLL